MSAAPRRLTIFKQDGITYAKDEDGRIISASAVDDARVIQEAIDRGEGVISVEDTMTLRAGDHIRGRGRSSISGDHIDGRNSIIEGGSRGPVFRIGMEDVERGIDLENITIRSPRRTTKTRRAKPAKKQVESDGIPPRVKALIESMEPQPST